MIERKGALLKKGLSPARFERRFADSLREATWFHPGLQLGAAVSGGADSVALLTLLAAVRSQLGIVLSVVHFNHQLRGQASDADERFVSALAETRGLPLHAGRADVAAQARREKANLEDASRRARYAYFEKLGQQGSVQAIATAHTMDDQAETVLAHILRGTGLAGLGGIHPVAGNVFRPLLAIRRGQLRAYLKAKKQSWRDDATNRDTTRTRARIRRQLLPFLEKKFNASAVEHLCQLAELAREDNANLESHAELRAGALAKENKEGIAIAVRDIALGTKSSGKHWHEGARAMAKRLVRQLVRKVKPHAGELGAGHVEAVLHLAAHGHSGKALQLPGGVEVRRERDTLFFRAVTPATRKTTPSDFSREVHLPPAGEALRLDALSRILALRAIDWPSEGRETSKSGAILDGDRLEQPIVLRHWRPGDTMRPVGHEKRRTLARLLNELGLTRWEKESWPVLTSAGKLAWALGLPAAAEFAVQEGSRRGVVITEESSS